MARKSTARVMGGGWEPGVYLLQVFGRGYLAGGGYTPGKPRITDRYTDDPREAMRFSRGELRELERKHGKGSFAGVPLEEALRAGRPGTGNPGAEIPREYRLAVSWVKRYHRNDWPKYLAAKPGSLSESARRYYFTPFGRADWNLGVLRARVAYHRFGVDALRGVRRHEGFDPVEESENEAARLIPAEKSHLEGLLGGVVENPGVVKRFLGGALGKAEWVLPFDEFADQVRDRMVRRGMHKRGVPLEPEIVEALREQWEAAREAYREGGVEAVSRARRGRNPLDVAAVIGLGVLAGAVQGVVEPYVTKHVYGAGVRPIGSAANPFTSARDAVVQAMAEYQFDKQDASYRVLEMAARRLQWGGSELGETLEVAQAIAGLDGRDKLLTRDVAEATQYMSAASSTEPGRDRLMGAIEYLQSLVAHRGETDQHGRPKFWGAERAGKILAAMGMVENPGGRFYVAPDDWPLGPSRRWWSVYDSVSGQKLSLRPGPVGWRYGSERLARKAADKLNRDLKEGKIRVDVVEEREGGGRNAA